MRIFSSFAKAIEDVEHLLRNYSYPVHTSKWQSSDISKKPEMRMRECFNVSFQVNLPNVRLPEIWAEDIKPNLPWANNHFEERVAGTPVNPGKTWETWPWALSADKFRTETNSGPLLGVEDWAYLAAFLDADGTIHFHTQKGREHKSPHIRLIIAQKERFQLDFLLEKFRVGTIVQKTKQMKVLNGKEYEQNMWRWAIGAHCDVSWILKNIIPHLCLKKEKAIKALEHLNNSPVSQQGSPRKKIWGREWESRFSHSYMQRYWPHFDNGTKPMGLMYRYGDLNDVVDQLYQDPDTRQAYLPVWFPEDTGVVHGERVPCTLGYHFFLRNGHFHHTYYIRSCDFTRHFRDDLYLSVRLHLWILAQLRERELDQFVKSQDLSHEPLWPGVQMGAFVFHCVSMHIFENDYIQLFGADHAKKTS